ncbi:MAG TPA: hypothetical protein VHY30_09315 [Verrucomicrobiae bacterium]|jgi:hypothetical protein|nr:hypothetical protein [Verrucomicrobiae bacterium]
MANRQQNEKAFPGWEKLPDGGRIYFRRISGRSGGFARYCKEVDDMEKTIRFWQEIYDRNGKIVARHEKFPLDSGHQNV